MSRTNVVLTSMVSVLMAASLASGTYSFNYGNLNGATVVYQQITEGTSTDDVALYGTPSISGDALTFSPVNFGINAANGSFDYMDGTLAASLVAIGDSRIEKVQFSERGDWTLAGNGTAATSVSVANAMFIRITNIDGGSIAPIEATINMTFTPNGGSYNLISNRGQNLIWQGSTTVDIDALITAAGYTGRKATKVDISVDNSLLAFSEPGTIAYIKKKQIEGMTITAITPEPASIGLLMLGGLLLRRRR